VLATNALAETVAEATRTGVVVHVYPVEPRLKLEMPAASSRIHLTLEGPPGIHELLGAEAFPLWSPVALLTNRWGTAFIEVGPLGRRQFYQTRLP
jgi:hypothetical protein